MFTTTFYQDAPNNNPVSSTNDDGTATEDVVIDDEDTRLMEEEDYGYIDDRDSIRKVGISLFCLISSFDLFLPFSSFCLLNKSEKENISIKRRIRNIKKNSNF